MTDLLNHYTWPGVFIGCRVCAYMTLYMKCCTEWELFGNRIHEDPELLCFEQVYVNVSTSMYEKHSMQVLDYIHVSNHQLKIVDSAIPQISSLYYNCWK